MSVRGFNLSYSCFLSLVSIQLLCRFEYTHTLCYCFGYSVSIQLLCRFEAVSVVPSIVFPRFQYNFCVGSRLFHYHSYVLYQSFNTTSVSVRDFIFIPTSLVVSFQYNFCVGSRILTFNPISHLHVSIQLLCRFE